MTGIQGWYDFSASGVADGVAITTLSDGSANARTITGAATAQPLSKTGANGINGLAVALFDGVNDVMTSGVFAVSQPYTIYAVISNTADGRFWGSADASLSVRAGYSTTDPIIFAGNNVTGGGITAATPKVMTAVINGASSLVRLNRAQVLTGDAGAGNQSNGIAIGAALSAQFWAGKIGEVFWTNVATVDTGAELYLKNKWATP
jgi:hypothetical protein